MGLANLKLGVFLYNIYKVIIKITILLIIVVAIITILITIVVLVIIIFLLFPILDCDINLAPRRQSDKSYIIDT